MAGKLLVSRMRCLCSHRWRTPARRCLGRARPQRRRCLRVAGATVPGWALALLVPLCTEHLGAQEKPNQGFHLIKRSHVIGWFDSPNDYKQYDVDVLVQDMDVFDELDIPRWRAFVNRRHAEGKIVCGELRPLTHLGRTREFVRNHAGLESAACRDLELRPIPIPWISEQHAFQGRIPPLYCSNNPVYRGFLRQQIYMLCEIGVDAVMVDDGGGAYFAFGRGGCFCPYCRKAFREYLKQRFSPDELRERGISDVENLDYREWVLKHIPDKESYRRQRRDIPFAREFEDFLLRSDVSLFESLQRMASRLSGRHIPFGWDHVDIAGRRAVYYHLWDVFYPEINYQRFAVDGRGCDERLPPAVVMVDKLADALGKRHTPTPAPRSWTAIRRGNMTGLLQQWIALSYANGGPMRYPRKGWCTEGDPWYYPPKEEFEPLYDFVRKHRRLLDGYEAVEQVGVVFTQSQGGAGAPYYTPLKYVCERLVQQSVSFGFAVAGDELLANRLSEDEADRFAVVLVPQPIRLVGRQREIVARWKAEGKAVGVNVGDDVAELLRDRVKPLVRVDPQEKVWVFVREKPDDTASPIVCHVIASEYDPATNRTKRQSDVEVWLSSDWLGGDGRGPKEIVYHAPGERSCPVPVTREPGGLLITIPTVDLWGILEITR